MPSQKEVDLYEPVADFLRARGYEVKGEVRHIDIVARRDDEIVAVELKNRMELNLVLQAVDRQKKTDSVYVALPARPTGPPIPKWRRVYALLKRLEIGLILVHKRPSGTRAEIVFHPQYHKPSTSQKGRRSLIREFDGRTGDRNRGGGSNAKIVTAYKETAIFIACALSVLGCSSPASLRKLGTGPKTQ